MYVIYSEMDACHRVFFYKKGTIFLQYSGLIPKFKASWDYPSHYSTCQIVIIRHTHVHVLINMYSWTCTYSHKHLHTCTCILMNMYMCSYTYIHDMYMYSCTNCTYSVSQKKLASTLEICARWNTILERILHVHACVRQGVRRRTRKEW